MKKKKKVLPKQIIIAIIISLVLISAVGIVISLRSSSSEPLSGKAFADLSSGQKQLYWKCMADNKCSILLQEAQTSKNYAAYRKCAKDCSDLASNIKPESYYCTDSDGTDFLTKSKVVSNLYPNGKEDYCYTFLSGKTYLMEGICKDNKYAYVQKGCWEMGNYGCEEGKCVQKVKLDNAVDTLVIVNTDEYNLTESDVEKIFQIAEDYWLFPKTQTKFNVLGVKYYSFQEKEWKEWLTEYFLQGDKIYPEYIVVFEKEPINGGYQQIFELEYLLNFYGFENEIIYCNEFKPLELEKYPEITIPAAIVDFGYKFAACGYNEDKTQIISDDGICKGEETPCIYKNGYQMCSNMQDSFYAQNKLYFTADALVHELMHSYADDPIYLEHFSTQCAYDKLGWDSQFGFDYYLENLGASDPFDDITQEYAGICPYVWQQFNNSKQKCTE